MAKTQTTVKKTRARTPADSVVAAVKRELRAIRRRDIDLSRSTLAMTAVALAKQLDNTAASATSKSMCAKALNETMAQLRERAPAEKAGDALDELTRRREERLAVAT